MEVMGKHDPRDWNTNCSEPKEGHFHGVGILSSQSKRSCIAMVLLVDVLVEYTMMQPPVEGVMPCILQNEEHGKMQCHGDQGREWDTVLDPELIADRVEEPDGESLNEEVRSEHGFQTFPLFLIRREFRRLNLELAEVWDAVNDVPGQRTSKVHQFMQGEEQEASGKDVITDKEVE